MRGELISLFDPGMNEMWKGQGQVENEKLCRVSHDKLQVIHNFLTSGPQKNIYIKKIIKWKLPKTILNQKFRIEDLAPKCEFELNPQTFIQLPCKLLKRQGI